MEMGFAVYFKPESSVYIPDNRTCHLAISFLFLKTDKALCPLPNPWFYFAIPGLKVFVFMKDS